MKILIAKSSGFCMGVRRAVEMVLDASAEHVGPICTYGPLIHNPQVLELLEEKGIRVLKKTPETGEGVVLIRAHGVPPEIKKKLKSAGFDVLDATCPRVIKIQTIIRKYAKQGFTSIIIGDKNHPEVVGLLGQAREKGHVIGSLDEFEELPVFDEAIIVAQTTQNTNLFRAVKTQVSQDFPHYKVFDTICDSTERRQAEVKRLADSVDTVIVVGGRNSGNTQRLVEIAEQTGKPTFHIETEADLDSLDIGDIDTATRIGITAGASTPNWILKKVYRALEELPFKRKPGWSSTLFAIQRSLLLTNIYLALGAGLLCYACAQLQRIVDFVPYVLLSILYVQSMHILNHLTGGRADQYNEPERALFYRKYRYLLTTLAIVSGGSGLIIAATLGLWPFFILLAMSIMGLSYNLRLVPENLTWIRKRRIKDIPGSKTLLIAVAWGIVVGILPPLSTSGTISWANVLVFIWSSGLVFIRTAFFDILDMQGDRIVGKETIAILLGEKRSLRLLNNMVAALIVILLISGAFQLISPLGFVLTLCPLFIGAILKGYQKRYLLPGIRLEFTVETLFVVAGLLTFLWTTVT